MCMNEELKTALTHALSTRRGRNLRRLGNNLTLQAFDALFLPSLKRNDCGDNLKTCRNVPVALPLPGGQGRGEGELLHI